MNPTTLGSNDGTMSRTAVSAALAFSSSSRRRGGVLAEVSRRDDVARTDLVSFDPPARAIRVTVGRGGAAAAAGAEQQLELAPSEPALFALLEVAWR